VKSKELDKITNDVSPPESNARAQEREEKCKAIADYTVPLSVISSSVIDRPSPPDR
jgi:hypothetical protein